MSGEAVERSLHDHTADVACVSVQMDPAMNASRPWLVVVLALFCLPLFVGLGRGDLLTDEAIYSFGVDRILESGAHLWSRPYVCLCP